MKRYAIYAYEHTFSGLHGMSEVAVITAESREEAEEIAEDMSYEVIDCYSDIAKIMEQDCANYADPETDPELYQTLLNEARSDDVAFEIYEITVESDKDDDALTLEMARNYKDFIKRYCRGEDNT